MKQKIILIGGGGHCKSLIDVIEMEGSFEVAGIIDKKEMIGQTVLGYKIIGCDDDLNDLFQKYKYAIVSVGQIKSPELRIKLFNHLNSIGFETPTIISPRAYISKHASVDKGTVVLHDALINSEARIGKNCIINSKALIEHDCNIADHCHISTGAVINGGTTIGEGTFFGSNAATKESITIAPGAFIKAGSLIK
ncbi:MAG TPA: acetyltransferase [Sulfuricurvum sp.]|nr:MAG: acetyltransferase [Campylobacterales bacterium 16-40-21]OZA02313.1 MAG: acetyltransferase [Sulfuricurvum sp. 17-40-25]HQS67276.1 acetyltransferase [Sulfuricurvum sp.]HQT36759.1 acetyltransferase [Sulfuricurvum sp.]